MTERSSITHDTTNLLIEGWRGLNHSYSLINQYQIVELMQFPNLRLFHHDLPYFNANWNRVQNGSHFPAATQLLIDSIPPAQAARIDCVYRASFPFLCSDPTDERRTLTFMVTEFGLTSESFASQRGSTVAPDPFVLTRGSNLIITPSNWARDRIIDYGFPKSHVKVVPHGVDQTVFYPVKSDERNAIRAQLGFGEDEVIFLNIGGALWNKGADILLRAFANVRQKGQKARLLFKDQSGLYGRKIVEIVKDTIDRYPELQLLGNISDISVISDNLSNESLRELYNAADCYVSPYRAEGFNLPVLEAIACGLPVIVTEGGATDDFCTTDLAIRIPGELRDLGRNHSHSGEGRYIEPDLGRLISAMEGFASGERLDASRMAAARKTILSKFNWKSAARQLLELASEDTIARPIPEQASIKPVTQQDMLDLLAMIQPRACGSMRKVRVGADSEGGYVLPSRALKADVVVSIGVGPDVSFEAALAQKGATVLQFDHAVCAEPTGHPNIAFERSGWGTVTSGEMLNFNDIHLKMLAKGAKHPLLKFDVGGAEYENLMATNEGDLEAYEVIVCNLHDLNRLSDSAFYMTAHSILSKLTSRHVPIHLHADNNGGMSLVLGVAVPCILELTFLRRDLAEIISLASDPIPGPLDRPNNPDVPDFVLTGFSRPIA